ncbi:nucleotidyltransferase domain-containing protein [candidate division KSB1 bacterium]|nr:nucleotidyltransferase domain-containing protein [candidate division KSB1 bacterium]
MATQKEIRRLARDIARRFRPQRIVLFGSYAYGNPTPDSDVDLLIITPCQEDPLDKAAEIRMSIRPTFPVDLLVRTPDKVRERLQMGDGFMQEILEKGRMLYEAPMP